MTQVFLLIFIFQFLIILSSNSHGVKRVKASVGQNKKIDTSASASRTVHFLNTNINNTSQKSTCETIFQFILGNVNKEIKSNKEIIVFVPEKCFVNTRTDSGIHMEGGHDLNLLAVQSCSLVKKAKEINKLMDYVFQRNPNQLVLILLCEDLTETTLFLKLNTKLMVLPSIAWLVYLDSTAKFIQFNEMSKQDATILELFLINARLLLMVNSTDEAVERKSGERNTFQFYRVFRPTKNGTKVEFERQLFTEESLEVFTNLGENQFSNLHKNSLVVTGVRDSQYAFDTNFVEDSNGNLLFGDSFSTQVLFALEFTMNFTTVVIVTRTWGILDDSTNEWTGMIGNLLKGDADLAVSSSADVPFRRKVVDFNMPTNILRLSAFFKKSTGSSEIFALVEPFQTDLWIALLLWLFFVSICLIGFKAVILRVEGRNGKDRKVNTGAVLNSVQPHLMKVEKKMQISTCTSEMESEKLGLTKVGKGDRVQFHALQESFIDPQEFEYYNNCLDCPSVPSSSSFSHRPHLHQYDSSSKSSKTHDDLAMPSNNNNNSNNAARNNGLSSTWREYEIHRHKIPKNCEGGETVEYGEEEIVLWDGPDCFQWAVGTVTLQGFYNIPKHTCYRIIVGTGCLSGVVIYAAYASTLISFLSVSIEAITNFGQLLSTTYTISIVNSPISNRFLKESPQVSDQELYRRRRLSPIYGGLEEAKTELLDGSFVFLVEHISAYDDLKHEFTPHESCTIKELTIERAQQRQGTMLPKNSPYKRIIDYQILRMKEYGLVHHWNRKYLPTRAPCTDENTFEGVEITSVFFAFLILIFGALIAIILFSIEKIRPV